MTSFFKYTQNIFTNIFGYKDSNIYNFTIPEASNMDTTYTNEKNINQKVSMHLNKNIEYMKIKYNSLINSDVIMREFTLNARGKQFSAFIFYIDGMVDTNLINSFVLKPLMLKNMSNNYDGEQARIIREYNSNSVRIKKIKKFNLVDYIDECLLPQNSVTKSSTFSEIISRNKLW